MNVGELIEHLKQYPMDMDVVSQGGEFISDFYSLSVNAENLAVAPRALSGYCRPGNVKEDKTGEEKVVLVFS